MDTRNGRWRSGTADGRPRVLLPVERAFVVKLRADADIIGGVVVGRVRHASSGVATVFESVDELIAWMGATVARTAARAPYRTIRRPTLRLVK